MIVKPLNNLVLKQGHGADRDMLMLDKTKDYYVYAIETRGSKVELYVKTDIDDNFIRPYVKKNFEIIDESMPASWETVEYRSLLKKTTLSSFPEFARHRDSFYANLADSCDIEVKLMLDQIENNEIRQN